MVPGALNNKMISIVLATHNEEANLAKCLSAVKAITDELIIADGQSSDQTVKIAKEFGAKIISTTNKLNFHINKQMAMDAAKGDLVLQLDADEVVDDELLKFVKSTHDLVLKEKAVAKSAGQKYEPLVAAWWIRRKNLFLGRFLKKGGQYPDPVIRLYVNGFAKLPQKDVHEQMVVDGKTGWAQGHLIHYANPTFADYLRKWNTYTSFQAEIFAKKGQQPKFSDSIKLLFVKPFTTWFSLYIRHRGYVDGFAGFVFALFSGLYHSIVLLKWWEISTKKHD